MQVAGKKAEVDELLSALNINAANPAICLTQVGGGLLEAQFREEGRVLGLSTSMQHRTLPGASGAAGRTRSVTRSTWRPLSSTRSSRL